MQRLLKFALIGSISLASTAYATPLKAVHAPFPLQSLTQEKHTDNLYPSIAGQYLVFTRQYGVKKFRVMRSKIATPNSTELSVDANWLNEQIRQGVALQDGAVGYVSNRSGPLSAWMRSPRGDSHTAIAHMPNFAGSLAPYHLAATPDGQTWCFDSSLEKVRNSELINEFARPKHWELIGQQWRIYSSNTFRYKMAYNATKAGQHNKFMPPALFVFQRSNGEVLMLPNAFDGSFSPDGKKLVFVRLTKGNYDLWMQSLDGSELTQLTHNPYADLEPSWSPDGKRIAFVSNRDSKGSVRHTSIYTITLATGRIERITTSTSAIDGGPSWQGNDRIIFHANRSLERPQDKTMGTWNLWRVQLGSHQ